MSAGNNGHAGDPGAATTALAAARGEGPLGWFRIIWDKLAAILAAIPTLVGVKGKDTVTIATPANPFPVEVENFPTFPDPIGVKGVDGATIATLANPFPVSAQVTPSGLGVIDANNSLARSAHAAGFHFVGAAWIDTLEWPMTTIAVFDSTGSAVDGLLLLYSSNAVDVEDTDTYTIEANNGQSLKFGVGWRYCKVDYTRGGSAGTITIQTILRKVTQKSSTHRLADNINGQQDTDLSTVVPKAYDVAAASAKLSAGVATSASNVVVPRAQVDGGPLTYDTSNAAITISQSGGDLLFAAGAGVQGREVQVIIPPVLPDGTVQPYGLHIAMGTNADNNSPYYPPGVYLFNTNQLARAKRAAIMTVNRTVYVRIGTPP